MAGEGPTVTVRVDATDETSRALAGVLEVAGRRIDVPNRIPTTSEVRAARATKKGEEMGSPLLIVGKLGTPDLIKAAASEEEPWQRLVQSVRGDARLLPGAARIFQIAFRDVAFEDVEPLRALLDLQHLSGFDVITIPYGAAPSPEDVVAAFDFARSWAKRRRVEATLMPVLPALEGREDATALIRALLQRGAEALGLDLQGGFPYHTLRAVEDLKAKRPEVWVHAFQVPPKVRFGGPLRTSEGMVLPYFGVDTFSRWLRPPPPAPVKKDKVNVFDPRGWGILKRKEHEEAYGQRLTCRCAVCRGKDLDGFYEPEDRVVLNLAKVHDHLAQTAELAGARKRIPEEGYAAAMADHPFARAFLERVGHQEAGGTT